MQKLKSIVTIFLVLSLSLLGCRHDRAESIKYYQNGMNAYHRKDLAKAGEFFSLSYKYDNSNLNSRLMIAKIAYFEKKYQKALDVVDSILNKEEGNINALYWKSRILIMKDGKNSGQVMGFLQAVIEKDSHHIPARMLLALLYEENNKYSEAFREYSMISMESETMVDATANLALLYMKMGMKNRAANEIKKAAEMCRILGSDDGKIKFIKKEFSKW